MNVKDPWNPARVDDRGMQEHFDTMPGILFMNAEPVLAMAFAGLMLNCVSFKGLFMAENNLQQQRDCRNEDEMRDNQFIHKRAALFGMICGLLSLCSWFRGSSGAQSSSEPTTILGAISSGAQGWSTGSLAAIGAFLSVVNYIAANNNLKNLACLTVYRAPLPSVNDEDDSSTKKKKVAAAKADAAKNAKQHNDENNPDGNNPEADGNNPEAAPEKDDQKPVDHYQLDMDAVSRDVADKKISLNQANTIISSFDRNSKTNATNEYAEKVL